MSSLGRGAAFIVRGFEWWRRGPRAMAGGLVPAVIAWLALVAVIIALAVFLVHIVAFLTPFADDWAPVWTVTLRVGVGAGLLAGSIYLAAIAFTTLTLLIGSPFYARIWRDVEQSEGGGVPEVAGPGLATALRDSISVFARGVLAALVTIACGFVPLVGAFLAPVVGFLMTAALITEELTSRAFEARGIRPRERRRLLRASRGTARGFGWATQACFLLPLGPVITMPAGVVGGTLLARSLVRNGIDLQSG